MSTASDIKRALTDAATGALALGVVLPEPAATVAKIAGAALGTAAALIDQGQTPDQVIAAMHRARRIDTSAEDAAVDALVAAKPSASPGHALTPSDVLSPNTIANLPPKPTP